MSYPTRIYGSYGDEKATSATKILPLGTTMELPDGRTFRYAKAGASNLTAGKLLQMPAINNAALGEDAAVAADVLSGAVSLSVTVTGTVITADYYADGYVFVNAGTSAGELYRVSGNDAAASTVAGTITLEPSDGFIGSGTALAAGTSSVGLARNPYNAVIVYTAGTITGPVVGVPPCPVLATRYFWCQRRGPAAVFVDGTLIAGQLVSVSGTITGGVCPRVTAATAATGTHTDVAIGEVINIADSTDWGLIDLRLE